MILTTSDIIKDACGIDVGIYDTRYYFTSIKIFQTLSNFNMISNRFGCDIRNLKGFSYINNKTSNYWIRILYSYNVDGDVYDVSMVVFENSFVHDSIISYLKMNGLDYEDIERCIYSWKILYSWEYL